MKRIQVYKTTPVLRQRVDRGNWHSIESSIVPGLWYVLTQEEVAIVTTHTTIRIPAPVYREIMAIGKELDIVKNRSISRYHG